MRISALLISLCGIASAQVGSSSLTGTVTDQQGKRVPHAKVRAIQVATGLQRETETTSQGNYELARFAGGDFLGSDFEGRILDVSSRRAWTQIVGQTRTLNARLDVSGGVQQATITEPLVQLDRVDATVGAAVEQEQINELPINGRNWATLTSLAPGAIDNGAGDQRTIRFAGHGLDDNNLTLDGVDATAVYNQEQREYMRLNIPLDSINQFQVQSQNFGADVQGGRRAGKCPWFRRPARTLFTGTSSIISEMMLWKRARRSTGLLRTLSAESIRRGAGRPIVHDKTFFYANYEGLRQRLDGTQIGLVPSPSFLAQAALTSPALLPILKAYPAGTSPTSNPNVWNYVAPGRQIDNEDSGMIRAGPILLRSGPPRSCASIRTKRWNRLPPASLTAKTGIDTKFNNGVVEFVHVFTPTLVNDAKVRSESDHLSHRQSLAGSVWSQRFRIQFSDRLFHH